jgi:hypothetical protein
MTTPTPVTTLSPLTNNIIGSWVALIKAHEKLLLAVVFAFVLWHFGDKAYDAYGQHLKADVTAADTRLANVEKSTAQIEVDLTTLRAQLAAKTAIDNQRIEKDKQAIVDKQKEVANLPLPQLAVEWQSLLVLPEGSITPQANGTIAVTTDAAHTTVSELEKVGPLTDELVATNDKLTSCLALSTQQDKDITSLKTEVSAQGAARTADQKQAKHDIRAAYLRGLKHGLIIGVPVGVALTIAVIVH